MMAVAEAHVKMNRLPSERAGKVPNGQERHTIGEERESLDQYRAITGPAPQR
jgi:hypothetical protein